AYQPPAPDALTAAQGETVGHFIDGAKRRGMKVWLQVQAAIPPGYRVQFSGVRQEDAPLGPDGAPVPGRVDGNASLAAPDILAYGRALLKDLSAAYPAVDGFRIDWPEYPPYAFGALFFDFSPHALKVAAQTGLDTERMRRDALALRTFLTDGGLVGRSGPAHEAALDTYPGVIDLLALKRELSVRLLKTYRDALDDAFALMPQAFPPPLHRLSGFDFAAAAPHSAGIGIKFYTLHWPMILADWGTAMGGADALAPLLNGAFDTGAPSPDTVAGFAYPEPDAPHPLGVDAIARKMAAARAEASGATLYAFTHGYGPLHDVLRRAEAVWAASEGRMWVNRYGYLSNEKLAGLRSVVAR
ncbi:MAG: hypothetical protein AAGF49_14115, partial [Pseudomonadota bacterium]